MRYKRLCNQPTATRTFKNIILDLIAGDFLRGWIFVLFIAAGLLIFGCVDGTTEQQTGGTTTQTTTTTEPTTGQETEPSTTEPTTPETTEPTHETEPTAPEGVGGDLDLDDRTYLELAALGVPIACDITTTYEGTTTTGTMYMVGEDKLRYEMSYEGMDVIIIVNNEVTYTNMFADMYPECEWVKYDENVAQAEDTGTMGTEPGASEMPEFDEMPAQDFECRAWTYDDSKFAPPTENVCTMDELMDKMMGGFNASAYQ